MIQSLDQFLLGDKVKVVSNEGGISFDDSAVGLEGRIVVLDPSDNSALLVLPEYSFGFSLLSCDSVTENRIQEGLLLGWFDTDDVVKHHCSWVALSDLELISRKLIIEWID